MAEPKPEWDREVAAALPRRRWLRGMLAGAVAGVTLVGGGLGWLLGRPSVRSRAAGFATLTVAEQQLFSALLPALLPVAGTALPAPTQLPVLPAVDGLLAGLAPDVRQQAGLALQLLDLGAVPGYGGRLSQLPVADAQRYLDDCLRSATGMRRAMAMLAKKLVAVAYWQQPSTWAPLDYDGPVSRRLGIPALGNAPLPVDEGRS